jgi:hypothetical protein
MLRAHRLSAVRIYLLILSIVLLTLSVDAFAERADLPRAGVSVPIEQRSSKPRTSRRKSSPVRPTKCAAVARVSKQRKARKTCAVKKARAKGSKPSIASTRWSSVRAISPVEESSPPAELAVPVEPAPLAEPAGPIAPADPKPLAEPTPPVEPVTPVEPAMPSEPIEPVEPSPPVEPAAPVESTPPVEPGAPVESAGPFRFFSPASFWNVALSSDALLDSSSAAVMGAFDGEIAAEEDAKSGPWINATYYSVPVYTVPADQPTVRVALVNTSVPALQSAWSAVPLPSNAQPAAGGDGHLVVWQPSTDRLWEFWQLQHRRDHWSASWGGAMRRVSFNSGVYGPRAWSGAKSYWGASGSSLSIVGGLITLEDLERGQINHALAMAVPNVRAGVYASPAERTDGESAEPLSLPEGAHLRLDPNLDLATLHLPRLTLIIAEAAQRYGIVVRDKGAEVAFYAQDPIPTGTEPYTGPRGYFEGKSPRYLLESFPWSHLQLLKMELHSIS